MATKTDFSTDEWENLRDTPHLVVLAVAAAGASGFFGSIAEMIAPSGAIAEALKGDNQLLHQICGKEEVLSAIKSIKRLTQGTTEFAVIQANLRKSAVDKSRLAINLLKQKGSPEDVAAYRNFLLTLGDKVANAAKEGGFLGFGGERVSEHERSLLAELTQAVGVGNLEA